MIDFPATPVDGQLFTAPSNGVTYRYSTTYASWLTQSGPGGGTGDFFATSPSIGNFSTTPVALIPTVILTGNAAGVYSTVNGRYTPPAGRYSIFGSLVGRTASAGIFNILYKNGVAVPSVISSAYASVAGGKGTPSVSAIVDANGTDYFQLFQSAQFAADVIENVWFGAFPLTGMQGPQGAPGVTANALSLYSEQVAAGGETQLNVTIPLNAKRVELEILQLQASGDNASLLQTVESGTVNASANHQYQQMYGTGTTVAANNVGAATGWNIGNVATLAQSIKFFPSRNATWIGILTESVFTSGGTSYVQTWAMAGGANRATTTGFRLTLGASSFLAGSFMRAYVVV